MRDPETGQPARDPALYREVVERVRDSDVDVVLNLTAGMGGDLTLGPADRPLPFSQAGTDLASAEERLAHVTDLLPEICTLDCGTMNFGEGDYVMTNTPAMLADMARRVQALGVRPEIEIFDTGHLVLAKWLVEQGLIDEPVMVQLCMGIPWGAPDDIGTLMSMVNNLPEGWTFSAFSISRNQLPYVALAVLAGGNIRVGARGQHLAPKRGRARHQRGSGGAGRGNRGEHGGAGDRAGGGAREARAAKGLTCREESDSPPAVPFRVGARLVGFQLRRADDQGTGLRPLPPLSRVGNPEHPVPALPGREYRTSWRSASSALRASAAESSAVGGRRDSS